MTKVYFVYRNGVIPESFANSLPSWRKAIYKSLRNEKARQESLTAGLLFKYAMNDCEINLNNAEIILLPAGKPIFAGRKDIYFSLSHSGLWAACAVSDQSVGIDVQEWRPVKRTLSRRLHPMEKSYLDELQDDVWEREYFRIWTRKEAWVKAISRERILSLDEVNVLCDDDKLFFSDFSLQNNVNASLCTLLQETPQKASISMDQLLKN